MASEQSRTQPPRRRQADRSAAAKQRFIHATITCLNRDGFGATSFTSVAKEAGLSRSLIAHHFANKADLMVAVRQWSWHIDMAEVAEHFADAGPAKALATMPQFLLRQAQEPRTMATLDIMLAARGDAELKARLQAAEAAHDAAIVTLQPDFFGAAGLETPANFVHILHLTTAAVRGLALNALLQGEDVDADACIALLTRMVNDDMGLKQP